MSLFREKLTRLIREAQPLLAGLEQEGPGSSSSPLREVLDFGPNPGALRMFCYAPAHRAAEPALVVVLHGCMQTAAGYDVGSGWSTLADRYGFVLLFPQQQRANNPNGCFNWFAPGDIKRDQGEARSIREMVGKMIIDHGIDRNRVFITGLSAGGAMTSVMLATYPDVFTGGAIVAGLPFGAAKGVPEALASMKQCPVRTPQAWGNLVRTASPHSGSWPRISVWHGTADHTVTPSNSAEILKQWTDVHGLTSTAAHSETVDGYPRQVWHNAAGDEVVESYSITRMAHGTPLDTGDGAEQCGAAGPYLLDVGISSTYHIAKFWGLTKHLQSHAAAEAESTPAGGATKDRRVRSEPMPEIEDAPSLAMDVRSVITRALTAAGLMKGR